MARLLIVYATTEGHTRKVANFIADKATARGQDVSVYDVTALPAELTIESFDHVIVAASIHRDAHQPSIDHFVRSHILALQKVKTAFLSVSLGAGGDAEERYDAWACVRRFLIGARWQPTKALIVAGALKFTEYDFFKRVLARRLARDKRAPASGGQDYEFTNWAELSRFTDDFLSLEP